MEIVDFACSMLAENHHEKQLFSMSEGIKLCSAQYTSGRLMVK
ncbi:MAG: hypothetical protein PHD82_08785 [Candidatus Riflebacteria bacterium]|nr:hypothetical protein [Candidatus Riflebacteria bacterium]